MVVRGGGRVGGVGCGCCLTTAADGASIGSEGLITVGDVGGGGVAGGLGARTPGDGASTGERWPGLGGC